jgi:hypothetical protein
VPSIRLARRKRADFAVFLEFRVDIAGRWAGIQPDISVL